MLFQVLYFTHMYNSTYLTRLFWGLNEIICKKVLSKYLVQSVQLKVSYHYYHCYFHTHIKEHGPLKKCLYVNKLKLSYGKRVAIRFSPPWSITVNPKVFTRRECKLCFTLYLSVCLIKDWYLFEVVQYDSICIYGNRKIYSAKYLKGCACLLLSVKIP